MTMPADDDPYAVAVAARDEALAEVARLEADLAVAVHEAVQARAKLAGHYCGGRDKA